VTGAFLLPEEVASTIKSIKKDARIFYSLYPNPLPTTSVVTPHPILGLKECALIPCFESNLMTFIENKLPQSLPPSLSIPIALKLAKDLARLHAMGRCHLDIKPENICLSSDGEPFFVDFEFSSKFGKQRPTKGSLGWVAPEIIDCSGMMNTDPSADLWSFGLTLLAMTNMIFCRNLLISHQMRTERIPEWRSHFYNTYKEIQSSLQDSSHPLAPIILDLIDIVPWDRIPAAEAAQRISSLQRKV